MLNFLKFFLLGLIIIKTASTIETSSTKPTTSISANSTNSEQIVLLMTFIGSPYWTIFSLTVLQNGNLISGSFQEIKIWNPTTGTLIQTLSGQPIPVLSLTVLQNGNLVSGGYDRKIKIWNQTTGLLIQTLTGHRDSVNVLTVLQNGNLVSGSTDKTIKIWNSTSGELIQTLTGHTNNVNALTVLQNGNLVSGSWDKTIKIWNKTTGALFKTLTSYVNELTVLQNGNLVSCDFRINIWNSTTGLLIQSLYGHASSIYALTVLQNGNLMSGSSDNKINMWNPTTGELIQTLTGHSGAVLSLTVLQNGNLVSGSDDKTIKIWGLDNEEMQTLWKATKMDYFFLKNEVVWNEFQDGILLTSYLLIEKNYLQYTLYDSKRGAFISLSNQNASISFDRYGVYSLLQNGTWLSGSDAKCSGWLYYDNSCYFRVQTQKSFYSAQKYCQSLNNNSRLVFINDSTQVNYITNYWKNITNFWTGLYVNDNSLSYSWLDRTNKSINWCLGEPSNSGVSKRLHDGCAFFDTNQLCLKSTPCRNGQLDSLVTPYINEFICQFSLTSVLPLIQLPLAPDTLESGFYLHTNEYLFSSNKMYKLILAEDGNLNVLANESLTIWSTNTPYSVENSKTVVVHMSDYGNLVMEDNQGKYVWKSNKASSNKDSSPYQLKLENDGTLNILDNKANTIWSSFSNSIVTTTTVPSSYMTTTSSQIVSEGNQCGGIGYTGPTKCAADLTCYILTDYFSQCVKLPNSDCLLFPNSTTSSFKDWRNENGVSPVKNQLTCNACWAFAVVAALESFSLIENEEDLLFSEQNLLDCAGIGNCTAGFPDVGVQYALRNGIQQRNQYRSYNSTQNTCQNTGANIIKFHSLNGFQTIVNDEILMKTVLDKIGPIIVSFNVDALIDYKPGDIIDNKLCSPIVNHNALAVGYGTDNETGLDYYIVKNSWGTEWGDNGYFKIARGKNMCGIGRSAIYLCPNRICKGSKNYRRTVDCQCGGRGFLGTSVCLNEGSCFPKYPEYNQCTSSNSCPPGWACNPGLQLAGLDSKCDMSIGCSEGNCYAQNAWFFQCKKSCPKGWSCRNPTVNSSNLNLWQYAGNEEYFKRIDNQTWAHIINTQNNYNLTQVSSSNDTVVLYESVYRVYYSLGSQFCYTSSNLENIYSSKISNGSWIVVYYESKDKTSVWTFQNRNSRFLNSYFVNIESLAKDTWILFKDDSSLDKTQMPNLGINTFFQVINKTEKDVILFTKYDTDNPFPYYKLNISSLTLGSCRSSICNASQIKWYDYYLGTWTTFYPDLFLYGPAPTDNTTKATTSTSKTTTLTKLTTTTKLPTTTKLTTTTKLPTTKKLTTTTKLTTKNKLTTIKAPFKIG